MELPRIDSPDAIEPAAPYVWLLIGVIAEFRPHWRTD